MSTGPGEPVEEGRADRDQPGPIDPRPTGLREGPIVPFAGLRRNARALAGGFLLLLLIGVAIPDLAPPPTQPPPVELLRLEVVRAIVGSIGIVVAVPLTTAVGVALVDRRLPFVPAEHGLAKGWDA